MKNVRTVIWDCDDTMWFHIKEEPELVARGLGILEVEEFVTEYHDFFNSFLFYFKNKKIKIDETLKIVEQKMPILYLYNYTPRQFLKVLDRIKFLSRDFNEDTLEVMKYLYKKGIKNIIKTDWWRETQENLLQVYGIMEYIEELHCCDNSYLKSSPLSAEGIIKSDKKEQYLILGDSLTSDIAFAKHSRIKSIWFNKDGEKENNTSYKPTFEVNSLLEVMEII